MKTSTIIAALALALFANGPSIAQESQTTKLLSLKKAQLSLERSKGDFERALSLKEQSLISEEDFVLRRTNYLQAQVDFQQALISFMGSEARIAVASATKYQDRAGVKSVRVTLRYYSRELKELEKLRISAEELFPIDYLREIQDVYVSLKSEGKIVSDPYERRIPALPIEQERDVTFVLLKDVENLEVCVSYAGKTDTTPVYLEKGLSANIVTVSSAQFSQEADLESQATYDLSLEKFSGEANVFKLEVVNLPRQVSHEFSSPQTQARLSQIKFGEGVTSMKLALQLFLPKNADDEVVIDRPMEFYALALDNDQLQKLQDLRATSPTVSAKDIEGLKAGWAKLELIPRGVGRISVQVANLYREMRVGDQLSMDARVRNSGTRPLNNIRVAVDAPLDWEIALRPDLIAQLDQDREQIVQITLVPPPDASVGDYESKIRTECVSANRKVQSDDQTVRIHISGRTNILGAAALVALLIGLLAGVVVFGVKMTRR